MAVAGPLPEKALLGSVGGEGSGSGRSPGCVLGVPSGTLENSPGCSRELQQLDKMEPLVWVCIPSL